MLAMRRTFKIDDDRIAKLIHANRLKRSKSKSIQHLDRKSPDGEKRVLHINHYVILSSLSTAFLGALPIVLFLPSLPSHPRFDRLAQPASLIPEAKVY